MQTKPKITFNGGAIKSAALRAFQTTMIKLGETFQEVIEEQPLGDWVELSFIMNELEKLTV